MGVRDVMSRTLFMTKSVKKCLFYKNGYAIMWASRKVHLISISQILLSDIPAYFQLFTIKQATKEYRDSLLRILMFKGG